MWSQNCNILKHLLKFKWQVWCIKEPDLFADFAQRLCYSPFISDCHSWSWDHMQETKKQNADEPRQCLLKSIWQVCSVVCLENPDSLKPNKLWQFTANYTQSMAETQIKSLLPERLTLLFNYRKIFRKCITCFFRLKKIENFKKKFSF